MEENEKVDHMARWGNVGLMVQRAIEKEMDPVPGGGKRQDITTSLNRHFQCGRMTHAHMLFIYFRTHMTNGGSTEECRLSGKWRNVHTIASRKKDHPGVVRFLIGDICSVRRDRFRSPVLPDA